MSKTTKYIVRKWGTRAQIDLAKEIAKRKGGDYNSYKGYVNKWFKHTQDPGKEYLIDLSKILNVSVESIILGEDIASEYTYRPTVYSAAKTGNEHIIDRLFGNSEADIWLNTVDEYGKSFVDYVIEFKNYKAFKTAIEKGYGYPIKKHKEVLQLNDTSNRSPDSMLTKMIIEHDDVDLFIKAFGKDYNGNESPISVFRNHNILTEDNVLFNFLEAKNILTWLTKITPFSVVERKQFGGNWELTEKSAHLKNVVYNIPSVMYGFNNLLDVCIFSENNDTLNLFLDRGIDAVNQLLNILGDYSLEFEIVPYTSSFDMVIQFKNSRWSCPLGFVPYVEGCNEIKDEQLKEKAEQINRTIDQLRK